MPKFQIAEWRVHQVRVTAFPAATLAGPDQRPRWWLPVVGSEPEARVVNPRAGRVEEAASLETPGMTARARLMLRSDANRIDWLLAPQDPDVSTAQPDDFGALPGAARALLDLVQRWFDEGGAPPIKRLAVGLVLHHPETDRAAANERIAAYVPGLRLSPEVEDFSYQINRPRGNQTVGTHVNRLSKWMVLYTSLMRVEEGARPITGFAVRLELDVNTPGDRVAPIEGSLGVVLDELLNVAIEIAANGDQV